MPLGRRHAEAAAEAVEPLGGERDLRQQHQHLAPGLQGRGDGFQIDLGLAGAGDTVEQGDRVVAGAHGRRQLFRRRLLHLRQRDPGPRPIRAGKGRRPWQRYRREQAGLGQAFDDARPDPGFLRQLPRRPGQAVLQQLQDSAPGRRQPDLVLGRRLRQAKSRKRLGRQQGLRGAERHAQDRAARHQAIGRDPLDEAPRHLAEGRQVIGLDDQSQAFGRQRLGLRLGIPDHARQLAVAERHAHQPTGFQAHARRQDVVVGLGQRQGQQNGHPPAGRLVNRQILRLGIGRRGSLAGASAMICHRLHCTEAAPSSTGAWRGPVKSIKGVEGSNGRF